MITKYDLLNYLHDKYDVTINQIIKDLKIDEKDIDKIKKMMVELIDEKWIVESKSLDGKCEYEYDPGEKLDYGGLRG